MHMERLPPLQPAAAGAGMPGPGRQRRPGQWQDARVVAACTNVQGLLSPAIDGSPCRT
jgi:hypothetical protein